MRNPLQSGVIPSFDAEFHDFLVQRLELHGKEPFGHAEDGSSGSPRILAFVPKSDEGIDFGNP